MNCLFSSKKDRLDAFCSISGNVKYDSAGRNITLSGENFSCRHDFYPVSCLTNLSLEIIFVPSAGPLYLDLSPFYIELDGEHHHSTISRTVGGNYLAHSDQLRMIAGQSNTLKICYASGCVEVNLNGQLLTFSSDYVPTINYLAFSGSGQMCISSFSLDGTSQSLVPLPPTKTFACDMAIDFVDDIIPAPYTKDMFAEMMTTLKANGFRRVYWIYYGGRAEGFWTSMADTFIPKKYLDETFHDFGDDFLAAATEIAHQAGLEMYAVFKPFDMSILGYNMPVGSEAIFPFLKNEILGGRAYACYDFVAQHPELCMQRRTPRTASQGPVFRIVLTTLNGSASLAGELEIWHSENNWKYKRYTGPQEISCRGNQIVISNLNLSSPFIALRLSDQNDRKNIVNTLADLVTVFDAKGEAVAFTYGLEARTYRKFSGTHLERQIDRGGGFREEGLLFDFQSGIPTDVWNADQPAHRFFDLNNDEGVIGMALGQNDFVPGCLSPAEPEAVNYWLKIIKRALDHGVDGIDLRVQNHCNVLSWKEYGFNTPAVEEYKRRYGVDVRTSDFDRQCWRRLQGEFFTKFLKTAKQTIHERGRKLQLHMEDTMEGTPDAPTMMDIHWDWQGWIKEGIPDEVTYKALYANSYRSYMGRTLLEQCHKKGIPVYYCPFIHCLLGQVPDLWKAGLKDLRQSGLDGLIVYENATIYKSRLDGSIENLYPDFVQTIKQLGE